MKRTTAITLFAIIAVLLLAGFLWLWVKERADNAMKKDKPVEYYVLHTPLKQADDELRNALVGNWKLVGAKSAKTGQFVLLDPRNLFFKSFTLTNWATVSYDSSSNLINSAGGPYKLNGDVCTETIETATGSKKQFLGANVPFRIRVIGDDYYQMGAGASPSIEQQWHRLVE